MEKRGIGFVTLCVQMCVYHLCAGFHGNPKRALDPLDFGLQVYKSSTILEASSGPPQGYQELLNTDLFLQPPIQLFKTRYPIINIFLDVSVCLFTSLN